MTSEPQVAKGQRWTLVAVLTAIATLSYIDRTILNLMVDPTKRSLVLTDTQISLIQGMAFSVAYIIASPFFGRLADRRNRRLVLMSAAVVWSFFTALCAFSTGFWTLFLARLAVGAAEAAVQPTCWSLLSDSFSRRALPRAMSVFLISPYIGGGLALIFGGALIGSAGELGRMVPALAGFEAWRQVFLVVGVFGVAVAALLLIVREPPRHGLDPAAQGSAPPLREAFGFFIAHRAFFGRFYLAMASLILVLYALPAWMPAMLSRRFGAPLSQVGLQYGVLVLIAGTIGVLTGPVLARLIERRGIAGSLVVVIIIAAVALVPATALLPIVPSYRTALVLGGVITLFYSLPQAMATSALQLVVPPNMRGLSASIYVIVVTVMGLGAAPVIVALLTDYLFGDPRQVGVSLGIVCCIAAAIAAWMSIRCLAPYRQLLALQERQAAEAKQESM